MFPKVEAADCVTGLLHEDDQKSAKARIHVHRDVVLKAQILALIFADQFKIKANLIEYFL
jgi:hypothetical protein